jgi:carotenoid cleavage dioxygenase-like enzyme
MAADASIARALRSELTDLELEVLEGSLPAGLAGHVFVVAPVGNVGTEGFPGPQFDSAINGDGMVYRFDFAQGQAQVTSRLVKSADFYTDEASVRDPAFASLRYHNAGILRISPLLGTRDYGNTALLGFRFGQRDERLLVTFDGGRPLEIDPVTLQVATPVGAVREWRSQALPDVPFPPILTTAHPVADEHTGELFLVNYGLSMAAIAQKEPVFDIMAAAPRRAAQLLRPLLKLFDVQKKLKRCVMSLHRRIESLDTAWRRALPALSREVPDDFLYLARWDGVGALERLRVLLPDLSAVRVRQTMHQIAVTRRFVVLMDTSMKITPDQAYNSPLASPELDRALRSATTVPQHASTVFYLIARADLEQPLTVDGEKAVVARRLQVPLEAVHFHAEYEDEGDLVTLHVHHDCTLDVAEWVRDSDRQEFNGERVSSSVWGVPNVTPVEVNRLARYVVHAPSGNVTGSTVISDDRCMWGLSLYAGPGINVPGPLPERLSSMFHVSPGFRPELVTEQIYDLYADYPHRMTSLEQLAEMAKTGGRRACIFRVDLSRYLIDHKRDLLELPENAMAGALQYVPSSEHEGEGFLVACVIVDGSRELWVLDPRNLARGPVCRLAHPRLVFGATLHSWWSPNVSERSATYRVAPEVDYGPRIAHRPLLEQLFEQAVYPNFG